MNSRTYNTYIMFTKKGRGLGRVVGPFFIDRKDQIKNEYFSQYRQIYMIEETAFATRYPEKYFSHIQTAWIDKLYCYFMHHSSWIGKVRVSVADKMCQSEWFGLFEMQSAKGDKYFQLSLAIDCNRFYSARFKQDLLELDLMPVSMGKEYYQDKKGSIFTERPISRYLANQLVDNMCLS